VREITTSHAHTTRSLPVTSSPTLDRRSFLKRSSAATAGAVIAAPALSAITATPAAARRRGGYGPLAAVAPGNGGPAVLALPRGFEYVTFGATGAPMVRGGVHARSHDGMAALATRRRQITRLARNQEIRSAPGTPAGIDAVGGPAATKYDPSGVGGVTVIDFDTRTGTVIDEFVGLNGTIVNCAGGLALHASGWITCEETVAGPEHGWGRRHGYSFLLPGDATTTVAAAPIRAMGRFAKEACATDRRGVVYQTEDAGSSRPSGFYRYVPHNPRRLHAGGVLQMLAVDGAPGADLREHQSVGVDLPVRWVTIDDPDPDPVVEVGLPGANSCFAQGFAKGGAKLNRLEGIWADGDRIVFCSTSGGDVKNGDAAGADGFAEGYGQVWEYTAGRCPTVRLLYESPGATVLDSPDNLLVTPRGGLILCEDDASDVDGDVHPLAPGTENVNRLVGIAGDGVPFELAVNVLNDSELAGACFSPDGGILFVNVFGGGEAGSGMTCAITGPWHRGGL
jgi:secreted PhoX family phosphatase